MVSQEEAKEIGQEIKEERDRECRETREDLELQAYIESNELELLRDFVETVSDEFHQFCKEEFSKLY